MKKLDSSLILERRIVDRRGVSYSIRPLTQKFAVQNSDALLALHQLIPNVEAWSTQDLVADGIPGRDYQLKWSLSALVVQGRKPIGLLIAYLRKSDARHPLDAVYIHRLAIDASLQRRGIGTNLLRAYSGMIFTALPWLRMISVQTNFTGSNVGVVSFYERLGFRKLMTIFYPTKTDWLFLLNRPSGTIHLPMQNGKLVQPGVAHPIIGNLDFAPKVHISTSNARKFAELEFLFSCFNVCAVRADPPIELTEPQIERADPEVEMALVQHPLRLAARFLENSRALPFVVEDTMLFVEFFNRDYATTPELPGYDTKRWWRQLGAEGLLQIMKGSDKRRAKYVSQIGAYLGKGRYIFSRGETLGEISNNSITSEAALQAVPYTSPWFFHSVFVPDGARKTLAEMSAEEFILYDYKRKAVANFVPKLRPAHDLQLELPFD